jgi:hypothetical protein
VLIYQNTFVGQTRYFGPASNVHFRNNLILGDGWGTAVLALRSYTHYTCSDYNGFAPNPKADYAFEWDSPAAGIRADYTGDLQTRRFRTLQEFAAATGQDTHSVQVDFAVFRGVTTQLTKTVSRHPA